MFGLDVLRVMYELSVGGYDTNIWWEISDKTPTLSQTSSSLAKKIRQL